MCYLAREYQAEPERGGASLPGSGRLRPRWIAAGAVTLFGGFAVATALVLPPSAPPDLDAKGLVPPAPATMAAVPVAAAVEQRSMPADDDVPTASNRAQGGIGHCYDGL